MKIFQGNKKLHFLFLLFDYLYYFVFNIIDLINTFNVFYNYIHNIPSYSLYIITPLLHKKNML